MIPKEISFSGMALKLSGFVCTFPQAASGSNPKHTIYAFINFN